MTQITTVKLADSELTNSNLIVLVFVTLCIGIVSGLAGMFLALFLHFIQHLAYDYSHTGLNPETFLQGVSATTGQRRILILSICGLIAGFGWWAIQCYGKPLVSIAKAVQADSPQMPIGTTVLNALLQIITVGLGSPLGREVAPRELGSTFACWLCAKTKLSTKEAQIMVACGAGAGLAAVYNVPLGGAIFTLETLLFTMHWSALIPALATSAVATVVSWAGLGNVPQYQMPDFNLDSSLIIWSILTGPIFGIAAFLFRKITNSARKNAAKRGKLLFLCLLNFMIIGLLSVYFPALLGNGKGPIALGFSANLTLSLSITLLILRVVIVWSSLRAGAQGGLLTPSLANGVLLAILLGSLWDFLWPGPHLGAYAVIGGAAFLAASQKMPFTAIVLTAEFTNISFNFLIPVLFTVVGSISIYSLCETCDHHRRNAISRDAKHSC